MTITLPAELELSFSPEDLKLHLALGLFLERRVTLGQGATIAAFLKRRFSMNWGSSGSIHYDEADALADVATAQGWRNQCSS